MALTADERLLIILYRAAGQPVNVYRAFGCHSTDSNRSLFRDLVRRLRSSEIRVCAHRGVGYRLATTAREDAGRLAP
jgi:hypothetical protein